MSGAKEHNKLAMLLNDSAALLPAVRMSCSKVSAISLVPGDLGGDVFALLVVQGGAPSSPHLLASWDVFRVGLGTN